MVLKRRKVLQLQVNKNGSYKILYGDKEYLLLKDAAELIGCNLKALARQVSGVREENKTSLKFMKMAGIIHPNTSSVLLVAREEIERFLTIDRREKFDSVFNEVS